MNEFLDNAREELKRADHLVYVSLKYTRTVDMIRHIVKRLMNSYEFLMEALLDSLKQQKKILEIPANPIQKHDLVRDQFREDQEIANNMNFYMMMHRIMKAEYSKTREFRRHVAMVIIFDDKNISMNINIDTMYDFYRKAKNFTDYVERLLYPKE
ncbi:hypothetical protein HYV81_00520 [Candidatus Woesearchaeota archaeon]|nr:hypothetical protein [Candidatus Woesearchaeota archaeon]